MKLHKQDITSEGTVLLKLFKLLKFLAGKYGVSNGEQVGEKFRKKKQ